MNISSFFNLSKSAYYIIFFLFIHNIVPGQNKGGRWQFENNGNDSCEWNSNSYNGTLSGSAAYSNAEPLAEGNYYLSLEDQNNYGVFTVEDNNDIDFQNESIAISLWVYPAQGNDNPQFLLIKGDRSGSKKTNNYALRINTTENKNYLEFIVHLESGSLRSVTSSFDVPQNQWSFIAAYYDYQSSKIYLWKDNTISPVDTFNFTADLFPNNENLFIGTAGKNGFKRFWGRIDDVRIGTSINQILEDVTFVEEFKHIEIPILYNLYQNYPNPFNPETIISFELYKNAQVKLDIYNLLGEHISNLVNNKLTKGFYKYVFSAEGLPSGVYYYKLDYNDKSVSKKMIYIK